MFKLTSELFEYEIVNFNYFEKKHCLKLSIKKMCDQNLNTMALYEHFCIYSVFKQSRVSMKLHMAIQVRLVFYMIVTDIMHTMQSIFINKQQHYVNYIAYYIMIIHSYVVLIRLIHSLSYQTKR